jgi:hypothetical protein
MKTAIDLYPKEDWQGDDYFSAPSEYQPMLNEFGQIVLQVDDDDYLGDSRVLYRDGLRTGWLQFGWGSCSGCDALQGCSSMAEVQELMDDLYHRIVWFESEADALSFFKTHDWAGDYSYHDEGQARFVEQAIALLEGSAAEPQG